MQEIIFCSHRSDGGGEKNHPPNSLNYQALAFFAKKGLSSIKGERAIQINL